mmetsp:Transcript_13917/g.29374  ORF Transcript_13917/g.29374 Transcript_13917/m.29374 type:complete len:508 (+) Transcript_13917:315-1838(+)
MGLRSMFGCNYEAVALYRISLGVMLLFELVTRFNYLHAFYSDEGTLPLRLLRPKIDIVYKIVCVHCYSGSMIYMQLLLSIQVLLAAMLIVGYRTKVASIASWFLYLSLTLRNTWLNFILDRYFHYLLFYSMFLPLDGMWAIDSKVNSKNKSSTDTFVTPATIALKLLVAWLYWDAGYGKYSDPLGGWTLNAQPLSALDTYVRHTVVARYMYGILGPTGLRYMTPTVVYAEMFCAPVALAGSYFRKNTIVYGVILLMWFMHVGIAVTMRNTVLLSLVANCAWCIYLPEGVGKNIGFSSKKSDVDDRKKSSFLQKHGMSALIIAAFVSGSIWFETMSDDCNQSQKHIWTTLLHCRWNVFVGAEDYVTWEIAPGRLSDGSVVDIWGKTDVVSWDMPGAGAPCTSTSRPGRWRSFPYLAELSGEDGEVLWGYLCRQWDDENGVNDGSGLNKGRQLLRYNFFMLQADVLSNMRFSATRKRLIHSHDCTSSNNFAVGDETESHDESSFLSEEL